MGLCISKKDKLNENNDFIKDNSNFINIFINKILFQYNYNNKSGIGFFCLIPFPDKNNLLPIMILDNLLLEKNDIIQGSKINLILDKNEKPSEVKLLADIIIYTNKKYKITFIEIQKYLTKYYLQIDDDLMKENLNEIYSH